jgi:hypothetical protein
MTYRSVFEQWCHYLGLNIHAFNLNILQLRDQQPGGGGQVCRFGFMKVSVLFNAQDCKFFSPMLVLN